MSRILKDKNTTHIPATKILITADREGQRLDNFLFARHRGLPKSYIYRIIRSGEVRINSKRTKPSDKLNANDIVRTPPITVMSRKPPNISHDSIQALKRQIIFEDEGLLVINKPANMSVHSGSRNSYGLIDLLKKLRPKDDVALAHRLDKSVSGCIAIAKTRSSLLILNKAFREQTVEKVYLALVLGHWNKPQTVRLKLGRIPQKRVVSEQGKPTLSHFTPQEQIGNYTLVSVNIMTGRTHQIRVHAAHCGHPLIGDKKYGDFKTNRQFEKLGLKRIFLHASRLAFKWHGQRRVFEAPVPDELQQILEVL